MGAVELYEFQITVPAGTPKSAPITQFTQFPARKVDAVSWLIPPGAVGVVGFFIGMRGVQVIPLPLGTWIIRSGEQSTWPMSNQPDSGDWSVTAYNTGQFQHVIYVNYHTSLIVREPPAFVGIPDRALDEPITVPPGFVSGQYWGWLSGALRG